MITDHIIEEEEKKFTFAKPDSQEDIEYQSKDPDFDNKLDDMRQGVSNRY